MFSIIRLATFVALALTAITSSTGTAHAVPVTWTLHNVMFEDGAVATGSFVYDADTNIFSDIQITRSLGGSDLAHYAVSGSASSSVLIDFFDDLTFPLNGKERLIFVLEAAMTNAGGTIAILPDRFGWPISAQMTCDTPTCSMGPGQYVVAGGSIVAAPEPATLAILGGGLAWLGLLRRRHGG